MKVAIYAENGSRGGVFTFSVCLAESLKALGVDVNILTHTPTNEAERFLVQQMRNACSDLIELPAAKSMRGVARVLAKALIRLAPDIYLPNHRQAAYAAAVKARRRIGATIAVCHCDTEGYYKLIERFAPVVSRFVGGTSETVNRLTWLLHPHRADHISHGVRVAPTCKPFTGGPLKIIYHGRLDEEQKRVSRILDVADALVRRGTPFSMRLIGDGSSEYQQRVQSSALRDHVTIESSKDWPELCEAISDSHASILTSLSEGFGLSVAEAMSAGLPAVAIQMRGGISEYVSRNQSGFLIWPAKQIIGWEGNSAALAEESELFAEKFAWLQANPDGWAKMSVSAQESMKKYSWTETAKQYVRLFESAMATRARKKWNPLRPSWIPEGYRSPRGAIEKAGWLFGAW